MTTLAKAALSIPKSVALALESAAESELVSVNQDLKEASSQADAYAAEIEAQNDIIAQIIAL